MFGVEAFDGRVYQGAGHFHQVVHRHALMAFVAVEAVGVFVGSAGDAVEQVRGVHQDFFGGEAGVDGEDGLVFGWGGY